jgi:hypothetical protein
VCDLFDIHRIRSVVNVVIAGTACLIVSSDTLYDRPQIAAAQLVPQPGIEIKDLAGRVEEATARELLSLANSAKT